MKLQMKTFHTKGNQIFLFILLITPALLINIKSSAQKKPWIVPAAAAAVKNPSVNNSATLKEAKVLYINNCAPCHGKGGKGDGPAAANLKVKPADHTSSMVQNHSDGSLYWMISSGHDPMPAYKTALPDKQKWELVNYIRTLAKKG